MEQFDAMLTRNVFLISGWVCVATYIVLILVANRFKPGTLSIVALAVAGLPIAVVLSAVTIFALALLFNPAGVAAGMSRQPLGALSWMFESGGEFVIFAPLGIAVFLVRQFRQRRRQAKENVA